MKHFYLLLSLFLSFSLFGQEPRTWTWVSGSDQLNALPVYGTKGVADTLNHPGTRYGQTSWTTPDGQLWIFGGIERSGDGDWVFSNDLWKYNPETREWTWVHGPRYTDPPAFDYGTKGVTNASNLPRGRRYASAWADRNGNLWLFGGERLSGRAIMNDMWKFDTQTLMWTWVSGTQGYFDEGTGGPIGVPDANAYPGSTSHAATTVDHDGNFWMAGGYTEQLFREDLYYTTRALWRFDPVAELWTFYGGATLYDNVFVFPNSGTKGVESAENIPPTRMDASLWSDSTGNLYWFGGIEYYFTGPGSDDIQFSVALRNDVWRWNPQTRYWTWVSGSNLRGPHQVSYGVKGEYSATNTPEPRSGATTFLPVDGKFLLFGGSGRSGDTAGVRNDLWSYDPTIYQWAWIGGSQQLNQLGIYGQKGVPDASNWPGARGDAMPFVDDSGNIWLYGGGGYAAALGGEFPSGGLGDLWKFAPANVVQPEIFESFNAKAQQFHVQLNWKMKKNVETSHFIIEHSRNGQSFSNLGRVNAPRYGNSRNYKYVHILPGLGEHYYRLRHVDKNGAATYSNVDMVFMKNPNKLPHNINLSFLLYPNPVRDWLFVTFNSPLAGKMHVTVFSHNGHVVRHQQQVVQKGFNSMKLQTNNLKSGFYSVVVTINGKMLSKKFIKL